MNEMKCPAEDASGFVHERAHRYLY